MLGEGVKKKEENYVICHQGRVLNAITVAEVARSREGPLQLRAKMTHLSRN